ncbi:hypothetical protein [Ravibacter arvi]
MKTTFHKTERDDEASIRLIHPAGLPGEKENATLVAGEPAHDDHYVLEIGLDNQEGKYDLRITLNEEEYNALLKGETVYLG